MTRRIFTSLLAVFAVGALQACSRAKEDVPSPAAPTTTADWVMPPMVRSVERSAGGLVVRGLTAPQGRVVIRSEGGTAYATGADAKGVFELRLLPPDRDTLFVVEAQVGQDAAPAPYRMLVAHDASGPIALLAAGAPSRRLDPAGPLDVIDSDGGASLASGRAAPGVVVSVSVDGRAPVESRAGPDGRWTVALDTTDGGGASVVVGGRTYAYPGASTAALGLSVMPLNDGWRVSWPLASGSTQSSWFPGGGSPGR